MSIGNYQNLTAKHYDALSPLVPKGADREAILDDWVERWANVSSNNIGHPYSYFDYTESNVATLKNTALRDNNPGSEPISLGELIRRVQQKHSDPATGSPQGAILLLGCDIPVTEAADLTINASVVMIGCRVSEADFSSTKFSSNAFFSNMTFSGNAFFRDATFGNNVNFSNTTFSGNADFSNTTFRNDANFNNVMFGMQAKFWGATFSSYADFSNATFSSYANFPKIGRINLSGADLRRAKIEHSACSVAKHDTKWASGRRRLTGRMDWEMVRKVGRLHVLTRASYAALLAVPLIVGVWPAIRVLVQRYHDSLRDATTALNLAIDQAKNSGLTIPDDATDYLQQAIASIDQFIAQSPNMPLSWLLIFFAAVFVASGHLIYQIWVPQLLQEASVEDLIEQANETNRREEGIRPERLKEAISHLVNAAKVLPQQRNAWLIRRNERTIWLPHELKFYIDHPEIPDPDATRPATEPENSSWQPPKIRAQQEVGGEDRKRIAIEEGERARYMIEAVRNRSGAWLAGGSYGLGAWFIVVVIVLQFISISDAAGFWFFFTDGFEQWLHASRHWIIWPVAGVMFVFSGIAAVVNHEPVWKRLTRLCEKKDERSSD